MGGALRGAFGAVVEARVDAAEKDDADLDALLAWFAAKGVGGADDACLAAT